jgi:transaldolase / glucose-6-phosphate isomerase
VPDVIEREQLGPVAGAVGAAVDDLVERKASARMWAGDHTLWQDDPTEVADRLGWLPVVDEMPGAVADLDGVAAAAAADGLRHAVVLGMGGSSLFPEVLGRSFPARRLDLRALDTTDPAAVARVATELDLARCLFVAASKSGTTIETRSQLEHFWAATGELGGDLDRGARFVAVTDPGSELAELARERRFRHVFENRPDIGGRYSALSHFGLVPGALLGVDVASLLQRAAAVAGATGPAVAGGDDPAVRLAAVVGAAARAGRDKLTLVLPEDIASFGLWLEQLVAESTGKQGTGIVPVAGEPLGPPEVYGDDRLFVAVGDGSRPELDALADAGHPVVVLSYAEPLDLGGLVLLWEEAVALAGVVLGINPFDQPDVASAKEATSQVLAEGLPDLPTEPVGAVLDQVGPGDYLVLQAFVDPGDTDLLAGRGAMRVALRDRLRVATTVGVGPRFLHSTGQLHKGGPPSAVFLQVVGDDPDDVPIPGRDHGFALLKQAQAAGDLRALQERGLRAARVALDDLLAAR